MWSSLGSCNEYLKGTLTAPVALPKKQPTCVWCSFKETSHGGHRCLITGEPLLNITKERGELCPVQWVQEEKEDGDG